MPLKGSLYMLGLSLRDSFDGIFIVLIIFGIIVLLIPIACCIAVACGAKSVLKSDLVNKNLHNHLNPLLSKTPETGHNNQAYYPPQNQAYVGYPPDANYGPQPPVYQAPNHQGGAYYPPPPPQGMQYGYPQTSAPPPYNK
ncbi:hypothetical protein SteCoe_13630 [Stentor coeruleus]|uniref:Uncharacterized protein n=1 Tax=Stentor coeruleus TaxID=5963 RepID=A0A1R2C7X8_9CILI|nr:hypothetical protein SteCoe_13630 [Stentor coeruleus]